MLGGLETQPAGCVALRIEIDEKCLRPPAGQRGGEIDGRGRLTDTALLICHAQNAAQRFASLQRVSGPARRW